MAVESALNGSHLSCQMHLMADWGAENPEGVVKGKGSEWITKKPQKQFGTADWKKRLCSLDRRNKKIQNIDNKKTS